ncbi:PIN domain-containing protein [Nocardia mangyaensis]|uniref:PIN domain-containing protein n=1 Tax=Nocardia mangyaensis TaxID=2213200 RepID=UPI0026775D61|nr:PIN domain-containing protein [Nocardia mangyaensis]MDO3650193.1 PIN domain-containing protein [Nocardia mangyaensis]
MSRRRAPAVSAGTVLLDSEALSRVVNGDPRFHALIIAAPELDTAVATSAMTLLEAWNPQCKPRLWEWAMSRIKVLHTDDAVVIQARQLMTAAGMHGHKYAIDAILAAFACRIPGPVVLYTSDFDDLSRLLDGCHVTVKAV